MNRDEPRPERVDERKAGPMSQQLAELLAAERARAATMVARDTATLATRLHDTRTCIHATGDLQLRLQRDPAAEPMEGCSLASDVWLRDAALPHRWRLALFPSA